MTTWRRFLAVVVQAARAAGAISREYAQRPYTVRRKSHFSHLVTAVDALCESEIRRIAAQHDPQYAVLDEEGGQVEREQLPLDG